MQSNNQHNSSSEVLLHQVKVLQRRFYVIVALFVGLGLLNVAFLLIVQFRLWQPPGTNQASLAQLDIRPVIKKDYQVSITSFYNNAAVSEVAYQLELKRQSISTKGTSNCYTPEVPPLQNGCSFVIRPYAAGIASKKSQLLQLRIDGTMGSQDKVVFDLKNTDNNEIETNIGTIDGRFEEKSVVLPASLEPNQQLLVRLWPARGSEVTIREIIVESLSFDRLQPITLELPVTYPSSQLTIYLDRNKNGQLDDKDLLWNCVNGFPGVQSVGLTDSRTITLVRDDRCVKNSAPSTWATDKGMNVLAPYYWLAVVEGSNGNKTILPFEVTKDKNNFVLKQP